MRWARVLPMAVVCLSCSPAPVLSSPAPAASEPVVSAPAGSASASASASWSEVPPEGTLPPGSHVAWVKTIARAAVSSTALAYGVWPDASGFALSGSGVRFEGLPAVGDGTFLVRFNADASKATLVASFDRDSSSDLTLSGSTAIEGGRALVAMFSAGELRSGKIKLTSGSQPNTADLLWMHLDAEGQGVKAIKLATAWSGFFSSVGDGQGNLYVLSGRYINTLMFNPGAFFLRSDIELRKVDSQGRVAWKKTLSPAGAIDIGSLAASADGVIVSYGFSTRFQGDSSAQPRLEAYDAQGKRRWRFTLLVDTLALLPAGGLRAFATRDSTVLDIELSSDGRERKRRSLCCGTGAQMVALRSGATAVFLRGADPYSADLAHAPADTPLVVSLDEAGRIDWIQPLTARSLGLPDNASLTFSDQTVVAHPDGTAVLVAQATVEDSRRLLAIKLAR